MARLHSDCKSPFPGYDRGVANPVLRYLAVMKAARDFGLSDAEIMAVAGPFDTRKDRSTQLADALADLILDRARAQPAEGLMF